MGKKYQVIVIDPPWNIRKLTHSARPNQVKMDYSTMTIDEISALPLSTIADDSCWCFLWTIQKFLFDAKPVLERWGFNYLLAMTWEKTYGRSAGMPLFGFRWNVEFILVGYRKKPELWPRKELIPAAFSAENIRHSEKPDRFYELISPLGENRIDIFARKKRQGWDAIGDGVSGKDIRQEIAELSGEVK